MQVISYSFINLKLYFDLFYTLKVIDAESLIVIFCGTYGIKVYLLDSVKLYMYVAMNIVETLCNEIWYDMIPSVHVTNYMYFLSS